MKDYRGEFRVFGLLVFALVASSILYTGMAQVEGSVLGAEYKLEGSIASFVVLVLIFAWQDMLKFESADRRLETLNQPVDKMSLEDAQRAIDDLQSDINEIQRKREALQKYVESLSHGDEPDVAMMALGIQPARRAG